MFKVHESQGAVDAAAVESLLGDEYAFCIFRGAVDAATCRTLADGFHQAPGVRSRGDQVPGRTLGTIHFLKSVERYLAESAQASLELQAFFADRPDPLAAAFRAIDAHLARGGRRLRQGQHQGRPFCPMVMRSWEGDGSYKLLPHEDVSQLGHAAQSELEFARSAPTVGNINICLDNFDDPAQGAVRLWNFAPSSSERERLGIDSSGYPYPADALTRQAWVQVPIFPGDVYLINGKYVHAVTGGASGGRRVTLAAMLAFVGEHDCVHWS